MRYLILILALLIATPVLAEETIDNKVLGLEFGQTITQVKAAGVALTSAGDPEFGVKMFTADKVPSEIPGFEQYFLMFFDDKLTKVKLIGKTMSNDPYGSTGKAAFESLRTSLKKKYKETDGMQRVGIKLFKDPSEFYQCLGYAGCGMWISILKGGGRSLVLELKADGRDGGFLALTIEGPMYETLINEMQRRRSKATEDAL